MQIPELLGILLAMVSGKAEDFVLQLTDAKVYDLVCGNVVATLRQERGLTQKELVDRANQGTDGSALLTQSTLSRIESGAARPDAIALRRLAEALSLTISDLVRLIDEAEARARNTATSVVPGTEDVGWYRTVASSAGAAGLLGLIGFAVGSTVLPVAAAGAAIAAGAELLSTRKRRKR